MSHFTGWDLLSRRLLIKRVLDKISRWNFAHVQPWLLTQRNAADTKAQESDLCEMARKCKKRCNIPGACQHRPVALHHLGERICKSSFVFKYSLYFFPTCPSSNHDFTSQHISLSSFYLLAPVGSLNNTAFPPGPSPRALSTRKYPLRSSCKNSPSFRSLMLASTKASTIVAVTGVR